MQVEVRKGSLFQRRLQQKVVSRPSLCQSTVSLVSGRDDMFTRIVTFAGKCHDDAVAHVNNAWRTSGRNALKSQSHQALCAPACVSVRKITTGDNSEVYVPSDAGFREFGYDEQIYWPPGRTIPMEAVVETVEEAKWDQSLAEMFNVKFGQSMPTIHDDEAPERDVVNYPRFGKWQTYPEAVRLLVIPDNWFRTMYPKTGVTGPYVLTFGLLNFLFSKEWLIYEHEMHVGVHIAIILTFVIKKFGPLANRYLEGVADVRIHLCLCLD